MNLYSDDSVLCAIFLLFIMLHTCEMSKNVETMCGEACTPTQGEM